MNELVAAEGILGTSSVDANMAEASTSQPELTGKGKKKKKKDFIKKDGKQIALGEAEIDPYTYEEAMNEIDAHHWIKAIKSELDSMYSNQVWDLVKAPNN